MRRSRLSRPKSKRVSPGLAGLDGFLEWSTPTPTIVNRLDRPLLETLRTSVYVAFGQEHYSVLHHLRWVFNYDSRNVKEAHFNGIRRSFDNG